jgi:predicted PurR-regulated permease PerM
VSDETTLAAEQPPQAEPPEAEPPLGRRGRPFDRRAPYVMGLLGGFGLLTAYAFSRIFISLGGTLVLIVVSLFIAAGLDPLVRWLERRGLRRSLAVLVVIVGVIAFIALFVFALVPVIADQVRAIGSNAPDWLDRLQNNQRIRDLDEQYGFIERLQSSPTATSPARSSAASSGPGSRCSTRSSTASSSSC